MMLFERFLPYLGAVLRPLFYLVSRFRKKITIPPTKNPILHTSASVLAAKIRLKKVNPIFLRQPTQRRYIKYEDTGT